MPSYAWDFSRSWCSTISEKPVYRRHGAGNRTPGTPDAVDHARPVEQAERRSRETTALLEIARALSSSLELDAVLDTILEQLQTVVPYDGAAVDLILNDEVQQNVAVRRPAGYPIEEEGGSAPLRISDLPAGFQPLLANKPVLIRDTLDDSPEAVAYRGVWGGDLKGTPAAWVKSLLFVPMFTRDTLVGTISLGYTEPGGPSPAEIQIVQSVASQAAVAVANARLYEEMRASARRFEALSLADSALFRSLDLDSVLRALVDVSVDVLGADKSMVATWDVEENVMSLRGSRNLGEPTLAYIRELFGRRTQSMDGPTVYVTEDVSRAAPHLVPIVEAEGIRSMIEILVVSADHHPIGFFSVAYTTEHHFDEAERRLLEAFTERAAVAISNAELYERAQHVASLEERQRLARELHDSVSQALYGIALGARTARAQLERDPQAAVEPVDYVLSLAEVGMAEMRALIFELRPESLESEGLNAAIRKQVEAVQARHGMEVDFRPCEEPELTLAVKEAAYRIAQESLHNAIKHSQATRVRVELATTETGWRLEVADNGTGFNADGEFPGHLGLKSMSERAENVGAHVEISSAPGAGTSIRVTLPLR